jgi:hypothetical protein
MKTNSIVSPVLIKAECTQAGRRVAEHEYRTATPQPIRLSQTTTDMLDGLSILNAAAVHLIDSGYVRGEWSPMRVLSDCIRQIGENMDLWQTIGALEELGVIRKDKKL